MKDSHGPFVPWDVMREHLEDAGFFWQLWRQARQGLGAWPAHVVEGHEVLLHGHLDALGAALQAEGAALADRLLWPMLAPEAADDEVAFAAAFVLATGASGLAPPGPAQIRAALIDRLTAATGPRREALAAALGLAVCPGLDDDLAALFVRGGPRAAPVARVLAARDPVRALALVQAAGADDPALTMVALTAAAQAGSHDGVELVARHLSSTERAIHDAARFAGVSLGLRAAWQACRLDAEAGDAEALALLAPGEENPTVALLLEASLDPARAPGACVALGFSGQLPLADRCVELMFDPPTARQAAEAFSFITGIELLGPLVKQVDEDPTLEDPFTAGLPWPDADVVASHWLRVRQRFSPGVRYLRGRPLDQAALLGALRVAPGARQDVLALELGLRSRGLVRLPPLGWWRARLERLAVPVAMPPAAFEAPLASFMTL